MSADGGARMDGGDVLAVGDLVLVGISERTNHAGAAQLATFLKGEGVKVSWRPCSRERGSR